MRITREVALTEVYLDHQAQLSQPSFPLVSGRVWAEEIAKGIVWFVGLVLLLFSMAILAPESRGDTIKQADIASELDTESVLPLAGGVDVQLANNLIQAQTAAWGKQWLDGSLELSIESVLRAIGLYVWDGGPTEITKDQTEFQVVWLQSHIAIDPRLTVGFDTASINFGEVAVTPEPMTLVLVLMGLVWLGVVRWSNRQSMADRIVARVRAYR